MWQFQYFKLAPQLCALANSTRKDVQEAAYDLARQRACDINRLDYVERVMSQQKSKRSDGLKVWRQLSTEWRQAIMASASLILQVHSPKKQNGVWIHA